ncbi:MAG: alpha-1,2-fucosyltransferase, partial [Chloroflexota bacterium]
LVGGLGNQLFQYAAGRRLSVLHQTPLKFDIFAFKYYEGREYNLKPFCIQEAFATPDEVAKITGTDKKGLARFLFRVGKRLKPYYRRPVFSEPHIRPYDPNILKTLREIYLDGYWQTEKYFIDIQDVIRRELTVKIEPDPQSREIAEEIIRTNAVSIHVRRGDYVSSSQINKVHGFLGLDYYRQCVRLIIEKVTNPHFFIFSDDPAWVVENLRLDYPTTYVTHNDASRNYEDLRLMSLCKHNIIANSSFSWWGAWLSSNPPKIVLAPQRWFGDTSIDTRDLLPASWIRV